MNLRDKFPTDFDLLRLYVKEEDKGPNSQIRVKGNKLASIIRSIILEFNQNNIKITPLSRKISRDLKCHEDTIFKMLSGTHKWLSLAALIRLLEYYQKDCKKSDEEIILLRKKLNRSFEYFSCGNGKKGRKEDCKAVKSLSTLFAKIIGAYQADGWMRKELSDRGCSYKILICDHYKSNVEAFSEWVYQLFGIKSTVIKCKKIDAWKTIIYSKIIGRYFEAFFGFTKGHKTLKPMPNLIMTSNLIIKKAYICGYFTFEGSVELDKTISLGIKCQKLRDEIYTIIIETGLSCKISEKRGFFHLKSHVIKKNEIILWMWIFEYKTAKWYKLRDFLEGFRKKTNYLEPTISAIEAIYGNHPRIKNRFKNLIKIIEANPNCDRYLLSEQLALSVTSIQSCLKILELSNLIIRKKEGHKLLIINNPNLEHWRVPNRPDSFVS